MPSKMGFFTLFPFRRVFASPSPRAGSGPGATVVAAPARLTSIAREHLDAIYRTARRLGVPDADMEDALQDVLLAVLRRLDDIEPGKERAFVVSVAAGVAANRRRRARRHPEDPSETLEQLSAAENFGGLGSSGEPRSAEQSLERSRRLALLQTGLDAMTDAQRVAFVLFELEELSAREIAEQLGVSTFTVVSRVRRARQVLSRTLGSRSSSAHEMIEADEPEGAKS